MSAAAGNGQTRDGGGQRPHWWKPYADYPRDYPCWCGGSHASKQEAEAVAAGSSTEEATGGR